MWHSFAVPTQRLSTEQNRDRQLHRNLAKTVGWRVAHNARPVEYERRREARQRKVLQSCATAAGRKLEDCSRHLEREPEIGVFGLKGDSEGANAAATRRRPPSPGNRVTNDGR